MSGRFASRAAVVTGAGQGIGREIARQLALEGASVLLNDRDEGLAEEAARAIVAEGGVAGAAGGDVSDVETTRGLVERAVAAFGRLDVAVANAGITMHCDFLDYRPEDFDRLLAVNLRGLVLPGPGRGPAVPRAGHAGAHPLPLVGDGPHGHPPDGALRDDEGRARGPRPQPLARDGPARDHGERGRAGGHGHPADGLGRRRGRRPGRRPPRTAAWRPSPTWPRPRSSCCRTRPRTSPARAWSWTAAGPRWARCRGGYVPERRASPTSVAEDLADPLATVSQSLAIRRAPSRAGPPQSPAEAGLRQGLAKRTRSFARPRPTEPRSGAARALMRATTASSATSFSAPSGMMRSA